MDRYLKPLKEETFFPPSDDTEQLLVDIAGIIQFQNTFLDNLEGCCFSESGSIESIKVSSFYFDWMFNVYYNVPLFDRYFIV